MLFPVPPISIPALSGLREYGPVFWGAGVLLLWSTRYTHQFGRRWNGRYYLLSSIVRPAGIALIGFGWAAALSFSGPPWELGFRPFVTWLPHRSVLDVFCWLAMALFAGVFAWSAATLGFRKSFLYRHADDGLVTGGPYALVRHPQFLASIGIAGSGVLLSSADWFGLANWAMFAVALWTLSILEETELKAHFGQAYKVYSAQVPRLFPN